MYTIFSNEKLGMPVEQSRVEEMRRDIEAQRLAKDIQGRRFTLIHTLAAFVAARKLPLAAFYAFTIKQGRVAAPPSETRL
jgi:hypothetical protein